MEINIFSLTLCISVLMISIKHDLYFSKALALQEDVSCCVPLPKHS